MIENHMVEDYLWEPKNKLLECGCSGRCECDDLDESDTIH